MSYQGRMAIIADLSADLDYRLVAEPPAITRTFQDIGKPDAVEKHRLWVEQRASQAAAWISKGPEARELVWREIAHKPLDDEGARELDDWIEKLDANIEFQTNDFANTRRYVERELDIMRRGLSKKKFAYVKGVFDRGARVWKSEIDETINFATFLRAVRATTIGQVNGDPTFNSPESLTNFLNQAVGA